MSKRIALTALAALIVLGSSADASAASRVSTSFTMPVRVEASIQTSGCSNSPGPQVTLSGALTLGGFGTNLIFRNNEKGTHTYTTDESISNVTVLPVGESVSIPKQPVQGGTGGNPFMWIQLMDSTGQALTGEIYLGRCVQGTTAVQADVYLPATAFAAASAAGCENNPGPYITLDGALALAGMNSRMIFRNNDNPVGGPHSADEESSVDVTILPEGTIQFPKQPVLGGVGGNPWISLQFLQGSGAAIGEEFLLGRCVQLSK